MHGSIKNKNEKIQFTTIINGPITSKNAVKVAQKNLLKRLNWFKSPFLGPFSVLPLIYSALPNRQLDIRSQCDFHNCLFLPLRNLRIERKFTTFRALRENEVFQRPLNHPVYLEDGQGQKQRKFVVKNQHCYCEAILLTPKITSGTSRNKNFSDE